MFFIFNKLGRFLIGHTGITSQKIHLTTSYVDIGSFNLRIINICNSHNQFKIKILSRFQCLREKLHFYSRFVERTINKK